MTRTIKVEPLGRDWAVKSDLLDSEMTFQSGAAAEAAARLLADRTAKAGQVAAIEIYLRDGALAGRLMCPPLPTPGATSALAERRFEVI
jgi:hypothetical protein